MLRDQNASQPITLHHKPVVPEYGYAKFAPEIDAIRRLNIIIAVGRDDPNIENNRALSRAVRRRRSARGGRGR